MKTLSQYDENENLVGQVAYQYGYDHERIQMSHGNTYEKLYLGNCELITQNGNTQWNTFISGPLGVFAAVTSNGTTESLRYIYKDHLGSWTTITDDAGTILEEMSYDAWGNIRIPGLWTNGSYSGLILYDRGFTGHEHLFSFGLINMNGRMYDPVMSSFLSVDNYVQRPDFSQSFNRYAYCLNNPLRYVDPSGEFLTWSINQYGFSIGLNFTPAGYPLGFGLNVSWANGGSVGVYGEVAYRVGGTGLGTGVGVQASYDYDFVSGGSFTTSGFGFASYGCFSAGGSGNYSYSFANQSGTYGWGVNAGVGYGRSDGNLGGGLSIGYGSGGLTFGANGYYNRMQKSSTKVLSTAIVEGSDGLLPIGQESDHGCLEAVYQWIAETYGLELSAEKKAQIAACIVQDKDGNWFLHSGNVFMDVIKSGHKPFVQEGYPTDMMGIIYDEIEKGSRVVVNLAPREERIGAHVYSIDDGHSIGIQSVSKMQKTNIWGNTSSYYSVRVMDPGMNGNNGGYKYISPDYIKSSQNMSIFYRIR